MEEIRINKFEIDKLKENDKIIILGKHKSHLIKDILYTYRYKINECVMMSTIKDNIIEKLFPPLFVYNYFDAEKIKKLLELLKARKEHNISTKTLLLLNECDNSKEIDELLGLNLIIIVCTNISSFSLNKFNHIFITSNIVIPNLHKFTTDFDSFDIKKIMEKCIHKKDAMIINDKKVYWYTWKDHNKFLLGDVKYYKN